MERAGDGGLEALKWKKGNGLRGRRKNLKVGTMEGDAEWQRRRTSRRRQ